MVAKKIPSFSPPSQVAATNIFIFVNDKYENINEHKSSRKNLMSSTVYNTVRNRRTTLRLI